MPRLLPRAVALSSLLIALCGCSTLAKYTDISAAIKEANDMQATLAALPPRCTLGDAAGGADAWIAAPQVATAPGFLSSWLYTFNEPVGTDAFRVGLNPNALQHLEKVETRDAQGTWSVAWTGGQLASPAGCDAVKLAHTFAAGRRDITAMRIVLHPMFEKMMFANVGVRKAG